MARRRANYSESFIDWICRRPSTRNLTAHPLAHWREAAKRLTATRYWGPCRKPIGGEDDDRERLRITRHVDRPWVQYRYLHSDGIVPDADQPEVELTAADLAAMRAMASAGIPFSAIAAQFGVTRRKVSDLVTDRQGTLVIVHGPPIVSLVKKYPADLIQELPLPLPIPE